MFDSIVTAFLSQGEYLLRILIASLCGGAIGMERSHRQKEAGLRTHIIVALGSSLAMVVSKYAFSDVTSTELMRVDASRVASTILTSISFLGAGIIFIRRGSVTGLTTAAGIWATAAVGISIGAGMYIIGVTTTVYIILIQLAMHGFLKFLEKNNHDCWDVVLADCPQVLSAFKDQLRCHNINVVSSSVEKRDGGTIHMVLTVSVKKAITLDDITALMEENPNIRSMVA